MPDPETLQAVTARAAAVADLRTKLGKEIASLRREITAADRDGHGRNEIARQAAKGLSRKLVFETLGAEDLVTLAEEALKSAGFKQSDDYLIRTDPRPAITLGSDVGEHSSRPDDERRRVANGITDALAEAGILVGDVDRLAEWEFTTLARKDA